MKLRYVLTHALGRGHWRVVFRLRDGRPPPHAMRGLLWPICQAPMFQNVRRADDSRRTPGLHGSGSEPQRGTDLPSPVVPPKSGAPSTARLRRVLRRARDGVALNVDEAAIAMTARGDDLADFAPAPRESATPA